QPATKACDSVAGPGKPATHVVGEWAAIRSTNVLFPEFGSKPRLRKLDSDSRMRWKWLPNEPEPMPSNALFVAVVPAAATSKSWLAVTPLSEIAPRAKPAARVARITECVVAASLIPVSAAMPAVGAPESRASIHKNRALLLAIRQCSLDGSGLVVGLAS